MSQVNSIIRRISFARRYTLGLLDSVDDADWSRMPGGCPTNIAWQAGHLAMAEYRLCLERVRGPRPEDAALISPEFIARFHRDSTPREADEGRPSPAEIRAVMARVHEAALSLLDQIDDPLLAEPIHTPHAFCSTKAEIYDWCSAHEMLHAGQIGLLRRALGAAPRW
ncbi:DinB family protein [Isosphaeraceae bacterium EP7]